ncbi:polysaccharide biosynthesis/export family protein [Salinarimonas sp.]|uniref:polysaccharide biosynthesis/export family protein n=1 Tax=Salinarimonas sp. TaxID=2766526 RepID=UPI0032D8F48B
MPALVRTTRTNARTRRLAAALIAALAALLVAPAQAQTAAYRLQPGDVVEIWSAREPQLNRDILVRPDGRISLPLAGHLDAGGLTLEELEASIAEAVSRYFKRDLDLVAILSPPEERDPPMIYVSGDVTNPGAYRYRPGMTVLHAVSVAGGFLRPEMGEGGDAVIALQRDLDVLRRQRASLAAQEARLEAETAGLRRLTFAENAGDSALADALAQEQSLMDLRLKRLREDLDASARLVEQSRAEVTTLEAQKASLEEQIDRMTVEHERVRSLVERGLAVETRSVEMRMLLSDLTRTHLELSAALSRARAAVAQNEAEREAIGTRRTLDLSSDLHEVRRRREETQIAIAAAERSLARMGSSAAARASNLERPVSFVLLRHADGAQRQIPAGELEEIFPGDLVDVRRFGGELASN